MQFLLRSFSLYPLAVREGFNKKTKKIWIYPYLGGWVGQDGDNIHKKNKKNMPLKSILDHSKSFQINFFFPFQGGGSDQALIQVAAYVSICYRNPPPLQHPSLPTNTTHYCQPLTPTATTHHNKPPLMPPTTSIHHCNHPPWWVAAVGYISGWWQ